MIRPFELGGEDTTYFVNEMWRGERLAHDVSSRQISRLYTLLPDNVEPNTIRDFGNGGKLQAPPRVGNIQEVPNSDQELARIVFQTASVSPFAVVILEDEIARRSDFANKKPDGLMFEGDDVYHVIDGEELRSIEGFLNRLSWAKSVATTRGFVAIFNEPITWSDGGEWAPGSLERITAHTQLAFLSAYDGESYLIAELI
jgi:hypothetical protein